MNSQFGYARDRARFLGDAATDALFPHQNSVPQNVILPGGNPITPQASPAESMPSATHRIPEVLNTLVALKNLFA